MQIFALDENGKRVSASLALRQKNYHCIECLENVRLRGGIHRQSHFYHVKPKGLCRQNGKSPEHLAIQREVQKILSLEDVHIEYRIPEIGRIADVACPSQKLIFEIQCSPISVEELKKRTSDYTSWGYQVIWILHDRQYNRYRLSEVERELKTFPHYYTNLNAKGEGIFYDQLVCDSFGYRKRKSPHLPIQLHTFRKISLQKLQSPFPFLQERLNHWSISFEGDVLQRSNQPDFQETLLKFFRPVSLTPKKGILKSLFSLYRSFLFYFLDKTCD